MRGAIPPLPHTSALVKHQGHIYHTVLTTCVQVCSQDIVYPRQNIPRDSQVVFALFFK
jgi:hypothetical protein